jgi:hypothetical protein
MALMATICCLISGIQAQELPKDELSVYLLGGFTQLRHGNAFTSEGKLGGGGGLSYASPISLHWDVIGGLELLSYHSAVNVDSLSSSAERMYNDGGRIESEYYRAQIAGYAEQQHITYLQVPLMVRYKIQVAGDHKFYAAAGIKVGYSIITHYNSTIAKLTTTRYFPDTEEEFLPDMSNHGIGVFSNQSTKGSMAFKTGNISATLEIGMRWRISQRMSLYTGVFFDYGLWETGPRQSETNLPLVTYDDANNTLLYNSMLSSKNQESNTLYVDKLGLLAVGLKISLAFSGLY